MFGAGGAEARFRGPQECSADRAPLQVLLAMQLAATSHLFFALRPKTGVVPSLRSSGLIDTLEITKRRGRTHSRAAHQKGSHDAKPLRTTAPGTMPPDPYKRSGSNSDLTGLEGLSNRLTRDLKQNIRLIKDCPVLSDAWCEMADFVGRIKSITDIEAALPKEDESQTMWEGDELALRYVMEEGKLNLCLRTLVAFRESSYGDRTDNEAKDCHDRSYRTQKLDAFEIGMGGLLRNAWAHDEAVQTTDLPLLVGYVAGVLRDACENDRMNKEDITQRQEVSSLHYLRHLCRHIDRLPRFTTLAKDERIVERVVAFLDAHADKLPKDDLLVAAQALSELIDSEDFQTFEEQYLPEKSADRLATFKNRFLGPFLDDYDTRKTIQPLLRQIQDLNY